MKNLDEIYAQVQINEARIQSAAGEKTALTRQLEQEEQTLGALQADCQKRFGCSLEELADKITEIETEIQEAYEKLEENVKKLE
jgi:chromosome segregation ATPase